MKEEGFQLVIKRTHGCLPVFGAFWLAILAWGLVANAIETGRYEGFEEPLSLLMFLFIGVAMTFGRYKVILDGQHQRGTQWLGIFLPIWQRHWDLREMKHVQLREEVEKTKNGKTTYYRVYLKGSQKPFKCFSSHELELASRKAEKISKFLNLQLQDSTSGELVVRDVTMLDESLRDRARRLDQRPPYPGDPPGNRFRVRESKSEIRIDIAPAGFRIGSLFQVIPTAIGIVIMLYIFDFPIPTAESFRNAQPGEWVIITLSGLIALFVLAALVYPTIRNLFYREVVMVSGGDLKIERIWPWKKSDEEMLSDDLEDLVRVRMRMIKARADDRLINFGVTCHGDEFVWLHNAVNYGIRTLAND